MISVKNLEKRYGEVRAVSGVSFEVAKGDIVGLLGHNGAGKTTVMKVMTGFLEPTGGTVTVGGKDVRTDRIAVQRQIGYMPENAPLYHEMLVQEYLLMMADLRAIPTEKRLRAVSKAVRRTGLENWLTRPIGTLSKGYRQRVGLAQAILHEPEVLVLDEPTNGLDPVQIVEIRSLIRKLAEDTTIILSTHILSEIEAVCNRVVILIDGVLATDSTLDELLSTDVVRLSVGEGADDVVGVLRGIPGVESVVDDGVQKGFHRFRVKCVEGERPSSEIIKAALDRGWTLDEVAADQPSLENVFRDLMAQHVSRARKKEVAA